jgi:hypothetical protein
VVVAQEPAETLTTPDHATCLPRRHAAVNQLVADPLVIPLAVVVNHELVDRVAEVAFCRPNSADLDSDVLYVKVVGVPIPDYVHAKK